MLNESRILHRIVELSLIAGVFVAIAGFGGTAPLPWSIAQDLIFLGAIMFVLSGVAKAPGNRIGMIAALGLAVWVFGQWVGSRYGIFGLDSYAIRFRGLAFATAFVGYFISREIARDRSARNRLTLSLIGLALFESVYGLAQNPGGWQYIWTYRRTYYTGSATGTYINHNHFSALLEMLLPISLALALYHWDKHSVPRHNRNLPRVVRFVRRISSPEIFKTLLLLLVAIFIFIAIVFSLSRMGLVAAIFSIFLVVMRMSIATSSRQAHRKLIVGSCLVAAVIVVWIGIRPVAEHFVRLSTDESVFASETAQGRLNVWRDASKLIRLHPLTGIGLGCFEFAFTRFQSSQLMLIIDHAHNDYLELAAEIGIPAALLFFSLVISALVAGVRASVHITSPRDRAVAVGCVAGISALLLHSFVDFNPYIPANALIAAVLLGMCPALSDDQQLPHTQA